VKADPEKTVFQQVMLSDQRRTKWLSRYEKLKLIVEESDDVSDELIDRYEKVCTKLQEMNPELEAARARKILAGLGFEQDQQDWTTNRFSGGWRMRISLASAIFRQPNCLLLDEPTNHLDLNATIWLTDMLSNWTKTVVVVSHDKNFLNQVCTDIIHLENKKLNYYRGNYEMFLKGYEQKFAEITNEWRKVEMKVKELKKKSTPREKVQKFLEEHASKEPIKPYKPKILFRDALHVEGSLVQVRDVSYGYEKDKPLFTNIDFDIGMESRYVIVGKNGVGKTTLIKLLTGELKPNEGYVLKDQRCRIGYFHQHSSDILPLENTPLEYLESVANLSTEFSHRLLGSIGLAGPIHTKKIETLSGGEKSRVAFCGVQASPASLYIFDEPTNHLDIETREALIESLKKFKGALILITHDINLIESLDCILIELEDGDIRMTNIDDYYQKVLDELE
jgi:ATP-binding cassette, subfamily F, member 1